MRGIAYLEVLVRPLTWDDWQESDRGFFWALHSPTGEGMVLEQNLFGVEQLLPGGVLRALGEEGMTWYRRPSLRPGEDRRPVLTFVRRLPVDGEPADVTEIVGSYADWLRQSGVPKLFLNGEPGLILTESRRDFCRSWRAQWEVTVRGRHFLQEDSPDEVGRAIADWLPAIREGRAA
jgi:haloalkane dehalogenase